MTFQTTTQRGSDGAKYTALLAVRALVNHLDAFSVEDDSVDVLIEHVDEVRAAVEWSQSSSDAAVALAHKLRSREKTTLRYVDSLSNVRLENTYSADVRVLEHRKLVKIVNAFGSRGGKKLWVEISTLGMAVARVLREQAEEAEA